MYHPGMSESMQQSGGNGARWALILALTATGCARPPAPGAPGAPPAPVQTRPAEVVAPPDPIASAVSFAWTARSTRYTLVSRTLVQVVGDSVPAGTDTITVHAAVTLAFAGRGDRRSVAGTVSDATVTAGDRLTPPGPISRQPPPPFEFSGEVGPGLATVDLPLELAADCASAAPALITAARELIPPVPAELRVGTEWRDSVTTTSCRAGVELTSIARHEYRVEALDTRLGRPAVRIRRTSALQIRGGGEQSRRPVVVDGTGRGTAVLWLDAAAGHLVEIDAGTTVMLRHQAGGRVATVEQTGSVRGILRP